MSNPKPKTNALAKKSSASYQARARVGEILGTVARILFKDPLALMLLGAAVVIAVVFFSLLGSIRPASPGLETSFTQITKLADAKQVSQAVLLDHDARIVVKTHAGQQFWAAYPNSDAATGGLVGRLQNRGADVRIDQQPTKASKQIVVQFMLPILLLVALFSFFARLSSDDGSGGIAGFSQFKGKGKKKSSGGVTFADVAGAPEALVELKEIRDYLQDPTKYLALGAAAPKGVLLAGPPGTGKTLLARAVAGEAEAKFFSISGAEFVESLVGVGAARVRDLFRKARKDAPAIIFIDELDAAGRKRGAGVGQGNDEREQTLNQLLVEMDGFGGDSGIVVLGATNRPDILDPALLRPGRFDRQITVENPDVHGRLEILNLHAKRKPIAPEADLREIAKLTPGFSGAELANVINEAALLTVRQGQVVIDQHTLEEAIDRVVSGPARKGHLLSHDEQWVIAIHEASHAVATRAIGQTVSAQKLSIVARGRTLGTAVHMLTDRDQTIQQAEDLERQLVSYVSGAAGELIEFGGFSTGVHDDLHAATALARSMVTAFGMSDALGPITVGEKRGEIFLGAQLQELGQIGPATLDLIDRETERLAIDAMAKAKAVLQLNWAAVEETAHALLEQETLSGLALEAMMATVKIVDLDQLPGGDHSSPAERERRSYDPDADA